ncbi:UPF0449 protein C19orf25 [Channa argus]|uniref:UPF0449 protein C19orf25 n=1 Tax=Channa argus TaxID=215402 RepID=A0A6G1PKJ2_CHAAH|nr:UPF0449 protein C19orf25 [Channa argus]
MNIGSKNKKRVVLPSRPDPPTVDQILDDIKQAAPNDPVFSILDQTGQDSSQPADGDVELKFQQCRRYLELNKRLQGAEEQLLRQREELRTVADFSVLDFLMFLCRIYSQSAGPGKTYRSDLEPDTDGASGAPVLAILRPLTPQLRRGMLLMSCFTINVFNAQQKQQVSFGQQ